MVMSTPLNTVRVGDGVIGLWTVRLAERVGEIRGPAWHASGRGRLLANHDSLLLLWVNYQDITKVLALGPKVNDNVVSIGVHAPRRSTIISR
jgi:hypothetical protein